MTEETGPELDVGRQREILEASLGSFREQRWNRERDLRGWKRMLERAESAAGLRAGRVIKAANEQGKSECRKQIAQAEFDIERLGIAIEDAAQDLATLELEDGD